jgi:hypothetical protein
MRTTAHQIPVSIRFPILAHPCRRCHVREADKGSEHCRECCTDLAAEFHVRLLLAAYGQSACSDGDSDPRPFAA